MPVRARRRALAIVCTGIGIGKDCQSAYYADKDGRVIMPTRNINLTAEQDAFVEEIVRAGKYQNASEAMRDAIRGLQQRLKADELKLDLLRTQVKAGLDALARGAFIEVDDADLDATLDDLVTDSGP
jgi:antitoxin ParD1/3/4